MPSALASATDRTLGSSVLTSARQVHELSLERARVGLPVHLRAVVTYYDPYVDPRHGALFIHDASGSIFAMLPATPVLPLSAGSRVEITGISGAGDFAPVISESSIRLLGKSRLPASAIPVRLPQLMAGMYDGQWVEMQGVVHSVTPVQQNMVFNLATEDGPISATTRAEQGFPYDSLIGATVRVHANVAPEFNQTRQLTGVHLYFQTAANLQVLRRGPADPYALPLEFVDELFQFKPGAVLYQRSRVLGQVTLRWPGQRLCLEDKRGGLCVSSRRLDMPAVGTEVELVGFPAIVNGTPTITDAIYRTATPGRELIQPQRVNPERASAGLLSGRLVSMRGTLISVNPRSGEAPLMLSSGGTLFAALLPASVPQERIAAWKEGSTVQLTGISLAQVDLKDTDLREGAARFGSFRMLLPGLENVVVLREPSWWNGQHTASVLIAVGLLTAMVLGWVVVLRSRVEQQTLLIRKSEERFRHLALHDPLTGLANRTLLHDRLGTALDRAARTHTGLAVLMLDLDKFKQINDSLGHAIGDRLLCAAAERVRRCVRKTDTVARIGGDEFVVLLSELATVKEAHEIAAKIVTEVSARLVIDGQVLPVSASVGVCTYPEGGASADTLLRNVDAALYEAKAEGRNCFRLFRAAATQQERSLQRPAYAGQPDFQTG